VLFPRTWASYQPLLSVGTIVLIEGKVDAQSTPPKILVDTVKTEFKMLVPAADSAQVSPASSLPPKPDPAGQEVPVSKPIPSKPIVAESNPAYDIGQDGDMPPPPDNFPDGWDSEWQPSFEEARIAARPEAQVGRFDPSAPLTVRPEGQDRFADAASSGGTPVRDGRAGNPADNSPRDLITSPADNAETETLPESLAQPQARASDIVLGPQRDLINNHKESDVPPLSPLPQNGGETETTVQPIVLEPFHIPSLYVPLLQDEGNREHPPQQITVLLRATGDKERDKRRIKTLHGLLISFPGRDKFNFHIFENGKGHLIDFPNDTTRICSELTERLKRLMGEENWRVEEITFQ
jgi:hypothetical protein